MLPSGLLLEARVRFFFSRETIVAPEENYCKSGCYLKEDLHHSTARILSQFWGMVRQIRQGLPMTATATVGDRLRQARKDAGLSLATVAGEASMSISTLSRIETGKQPVEVGTFMMLARILEVDPAAMIGATGEDNDPIDPLLRQLKVLDRAERLRLWQQLAAGSRTARLEGRARATSLAMEVEELLAQLDMLRAEIEAVKGRID